MAAKLVAVFCPLHGFRPLELLRGSQAPLRAVCGTRGSLRTLHGLSHKESACNAGNPGSIPGLGRYSGEGIHDPLQYPGLESNPGSSLQTEEEAGLLEAAQGAPILKEISLGCSLEGLMLILKLQ